MVAFASMPHRWRLKEFLDEHGITPYRLARETAGQLSQNSVYNLTHDPHSIRIKTLDTLIVALSKLTGEDVTVADLITWEEPNDG